jgi:membrane protein implicated in regulation of membrane protease activity
MVPASSWIVQQWSLWMSSQIFSTFSVVLLLLGHPELSSSSTDTQPALKHECNTKTAVWLKGCSPKAS